MRSDTWHHRRDGRYQQCSPCKAVPYASTSWVGFKPALLLFYRTSPILADVHFPNFADIARRLSPTSSERFSEGPLAGSNSLQARGGRA